MAGHYAAIIDELRHTAGRLALKHKDEKAKRAMKKKVTPPIEEPEQPEAPEEADEDPAEEASESPDEEQAENDKEQEGLVTVFRRATRHARVVAHRGHGQLRESGPPAPPPTVRAAAEKIGMPPKGTMTLKPRILGPKR